MRNSKLIKSLIELIKVLGVITIAMSVLFGGCVWWMSKGVFSTSKFDQKTWLAPVSDMESLHCYRGSMAFDIRDNIIKTGMSKDSVKSLLGDPPSSSENEYVYDLGSCSGIGMDIDSLHIYFSNGAVTQAKVIQH